MKKIILLVLVLVNFIALSSCSDENRKEDVVSGFLEAFKNADLETMQSFCKDEMKAELTTASKVMESFKAQQGFEFKYQNIVCENTGENEAKCKFEIHMKIGENKPEVNKSSCKLKKADKKWIITDLN